MRSVSVYRHLDELPIDVQQLFAVGERENVANSILWYRNLIKAVYPDDDGLHIYVLRKNDRPAAALPIRVIRAAFSQQVESLSNFYTALYAPLISNELETSDLASLIRAVKDAHAHLSALRFAPMDPESSGFDMLMGALKANGLVPFKFFCFGNWYLKVDGDWQTYLRNRGGALRSTIKRMSKKFLADGGSLELVQGTLNLERGLAAYLQVYASSWKEPETYPEFVPSLIRACAECGWLRLGVAWRKNVPIAAQLWIVANGKAEIYKLAYDESYKGYAPGTLLTAMLMEHVIENDLVTEVDYLIGDDTYKQSWMNRRRERWGIIAYNSKTVPGLLCLGKEVLGRRIKPLIARNRDGIR